MNKEDQYFVYTNHAYDTYYFKHNKLHREDGPAIVVFEDINKYPDYKKLYKSPLAVFEEQSIIRVYKELHEQIEINIPFNPEYSRYYLNGKEYSKEEFDAIILKKKLDETLSQEDKIERKKPKL